MTIEVPQRAWRQFFDKLNAQRDSMVDIRFQSEGDLQVVAQDVALQGVVFDDTSDACSNIITLEFGSPSEHARHQVTDPARLILRKESGGDHYNLLEMPAENGMTVVLFRPGISPALLDEL